MNEVFPIAAAVSSATDSFSSAGIFGKRITDEVGN